MRALFLDTSFTLALEDADDQYHREAATHWRAYQQRPQPLVSTAYVFAETLTVIRKRLDHARAMAVAKRLRTSPLVTLLPVDLPDFEAGLAWFERYHDKDFSFTDCVSFAVMKRLGLKTALTFDHHFVQSGLSACRSLPSSRFIYSAPACPPPAPRPSWPPIARGARGR